MSFRPVARLADRRRHDGGKSIKALHADGDAYKGLRALAHPLVPFILLMPVWLLMFD